MKIAIVTGTTRPGRKNIAVAKWVFELATRSQKAEFELVDIADYQLPMLDEPEPAAEARYTQPHTKRWSQKIASFDGYVFVTPEYNHGYSGSLKNAIDYLYAEWHNKAAAFVGYGFASGTRSVEQLRQVMGNLRIAVVSSQLAISLVHDFENFSEFRPHVRHETSLLELLDEVIAWSRALATLRS